MTDASSSSSSSPAIRLGRPAWVWGGALLIVSVLTAFLVPDLAIPGLAWIDQIAVLAGFALFAFGRDSVVARRPLGVAALLVLAAWPALTALLGLLLPQPAAEADATLDPAGVALNMTVSTGFAALGLAVAVIAVVQIWRADVVPRTLRWVPAASLTLCAAPVLTLTVLSVGAPATLMEMGVAAGTVVTLLGAVGWLGLGVAAILGGVQPRQHPPRPAAPPVPVYPPAA